MIEKDWHGFIRTTSSNDNASAVYATLVINDCSDIDIKVLFENNELYQSDSPLLYYGIETENPDYIADSSQNFAYLGETSASANSHFSSWNLEKDNDMADFIDDEVEAQNPNKTIMFFFNIPMTDSEDTIIANRYVVFKIKGNELELNKVYYAYAGGDVPVDPSPSEP